MTRKWDVTEFCTEAGTWMLTPYDPGGRVKGVGVDCGGLLYELYNPYFGPFKPFPHEAPDWALHQDKEKYLDFIKPYVHETDRIQPGGFSLFHMGLVYAHAAIMLEDGNYIHAWGRKREGMVTKSAPRVMQYMSKQYGGGFAIKHFYPNEQV